MASDLNTKIGFDATAAIATLNRLQSELNDYNAAIRAAAEGTRSFNRSGKNFDKTVAKMSASMARLAAIAKTPIKVTGFAPVKQDLKGVADAQTTIAEAGNTVATQMTASGAAINTATTKAAQSTKRLGAALKKTGIQGATAGKDVLLSWQSVVRIFAIQTIHRAITVITNAFANGVSASVDYQLALAEIQTIGENLNMSMGKLGAKVREISEEFAQPLEAVAEGVYETLSNQVADGTEAFEFLATANRFATAAVTDTASSVNLLSSVINSYGFAASDAEEISGKLFRTIDLGRIRGEEFADTYGRVLVLSSQLGVSFDEVNASIATLTVQGLKYNEAFTLLNNVQLKLIRPTDNLKKTFKALGIASAEAGIQAYGLQGFLEKLTEQSGDSASEIGDLFNRVRAIRGVLGLAGNQTESFADALNQIEAAGIEDLANAFDIIFETDAKKFQKELTRLKNLFVDTFGRDTVTLLNTAFSALGGGPEALGAVTAAAAAAATAYIAFATTIISSNIALVTSFKGLRIGAILAYRAMLAFVATPLGGALALGLAVGAIVASLNNLANIGRKSTESLAEGLDQAARAAVRSEKIRRSTIEETEKKTFATVQQYLQKRQQLYLQDAKTAEELQDAVFNSLTSQIQSRIGAYEQFANAVRDASQDAANSLKTLRDEQSSILDEISQFNFDRGIKGLNAQTQAWKQIQRSQQLVRDSNKALKAGDRERAKDLASQAKSAAKQALSSADQSKNAGSIYKATKQVNEAFGQQLRLNKDAQKEQKGALEVANEIRVAEEARIVRIEAIKEKYEEVVEVIRDGKISPDINLETLKEDAGKIAKLLQDELAEAGKNLRILEFYQPDKAEIRKKFEEPFRDPITGITVDLTEVTQINLARILAKLNEQADAMPESLKIPLEKLTSKEIGARGLGDVQKTLPGIQKDIQEASTAAKELPVATAAWSKQLNVAHDSIVDVVDVAIRLGRQWIFSSDPGAGFLKVWDPQVLGNITNELTNLAIGADYAGNNLAEFGDLDPELQALTQEFATLAKFITETLRPENYDAAGAEQVGEALKRIDELATQAQVHGIEPLANVMRNAADELEKVADKAREAVQTKLTAETLKPLEEQLEIIKAAMGDVGNEATNAGDATKAAVDKSISALGSETRAVNAATAAYIRKAAAAAAAEGGGGSQAAHYGALIRRQLGGLAFDPKTLYRAAGGQVGMDSVSVMAQPGESFNTVAATRKFFPQIQAMNAGITPTFNRVDSGTTNNFGDVNIEVSEAASPRETAREVMKTIKRESRRHTFNLRRSQ